MGIGIVEGLVTAAVVNLVWKAEPELLRHCATHGPADQASVRKVLVGLGLAAAVTGGALSWFASANPDGLEWSIAGVTGADEIAQPSGGIYETLGTLQEKTAILPDYGFRAAGEGAAPASAPAWPAVDAGTSLAGIIGGVLTLMIAIGIGWLLRRRAAAA